MPNLPTPPAAEPAEELDPRRYSDFRIVERPTGQDLVDYCILTGHPFLTRAGELRRELRFTYAGHEGAYELSEMISPVAGADSPLALRRLAVRGAPIAEATAEALLHSAASPEGEGDPERASKQRDEAHEYRRAAAILRGLAVAEVRFGVDEPAGAAVHRLED